MGQASIIFPERESISLEFKSQILRFPSLIKTCIAFANGSGGRIIIGVEDETRKVIGIKDDDRNRMYDDFPNSLFDGLCCNIHHRGETEIYDLTHTT